MSALAELSTTRSNTSSLPSAETSKSRTSKSAPRGVLILGTGHEIDQPDVLLADVAVQDDDFAIVAVKPTRPRAARQHQGALRIGVPVGR